jgi:hypothetical protein
MDILFLIGYIIALPLLGLIVYRLKVLGFKSYFRNVTEFVGTEKNLFSEINHFCLALTSLLAPIILFAYPSFVEQYPESFETTRNLLLNVTALSIYIAAIFAGFYYIVYVLGKMWKSWKDKKSSK